MCSTARLPCGFSPEEGWPWRSGKDPGWSQAFHTVVSCPLSFSLSLARALARSLLPKSHLQATFFFKSTFYYIFLIYKYSVLRTVKVNSYFHVKIAQFCIFSYTNILLKASPPQNTTEGWLFFFFLFFFLLNTFLEQVKDPITHSVVELFFCVFSYSNFIIACFSLPSSKPIWGIGFFFFQTHFVQQMKDHSFDSSTVLCVTLFIFKFYS